MAEGDNAKILDHIKAALGLQPDYTAFDIELLMHINATLSSLHQLGVPDDAPFIATANSKWEELLPDDKVEMAKMYIFLKVKIVFDPASVTPAVLASYERTIAELEFRLCVATDPLVPWAPPEIDVDDDVILILDGGGA